MDEERLNQSEEPIHILIVDDQWLIREGISSMLEIDDGFKVVGVAADGQEAVTKANAAKPDIILMDVRMPNMTGIEATGIIRQTNPDCQIIMLTTFADEEYVVQSLLAGACGYLMKETSARDLMQAIRLAHAGIFQLGPEIAGSLVGSLRQQQVEPYRKPTVDIPLTQREIEILILLANGETNREIAQRLVISEGTIKNHVSNILKSLNLRDRTQAAVYAVRHGLA